MKIIFLLLNKSFLYFLEVCLKKPSMKFLNMNSQYFLILNGINEAINQTIAMILTSVHRLLRIVFLISKYPKIVWTNLIVLFPKVSMTLLQHRLDNRRFFLAGLSNCNISKMIYYRKNTVSFTAI